MADSTPNDIYENKAIGTGQTVPVDTPPEEVVAETAVGARPTETPPGEEEAVAAGAGAAVWHSGKKIAALWSINENRNSWINVAGVGWKKLANNSNSAIVALTMLASHARDKGGNVSLREDGGQIKEMYVW